MRVPTPTVALALHLALLTLPAPAALPAIDFGAEMPQMLGRQASTLVMPVAASLPWNTEAPLALVAATRAAQERAAEAHRTEELSSAAEAAARRAERTAASKYAAEMAVALQRAAGAGAEAARLAAAPGTDAAKAREIPEYVAGQTGLASGYLAAHVSGLASAVTSTSKESDLVRLAAQQVGAVPARRTRRPERCGGSAPRGSRPSPAHSRSHPGAQAVAAAEAVSSAASAPATQASLRAAAEFASRAADVNSLLRASADQLSIAAGSAAQQVGFKKMAYA